MKINEMSLEELRFYSTLVRLKASWACKAITLGVRCFYSTLVRLKADRCETPFWTKLGFYSTLVRLKVYHSFSPNL